MRYQQYIEDPSMIPELTEPETLSGLVDNLKEVQSFLVLYMNFSDDDMDTKMETFDKYRKEILKIQKFSNSNLLQENVKYQIPQNEKEFKKIQKQYAKYFPLPNSVSFSKALFEPIFFLPRTI